MAEECKIHSIEVTLHNTKLIDHGDVHVKSFRAFPILDLVDIKGSYSHSASSYLCLESPV